METTHTLSEPRRLTRPRDGRWLGGVAAGIGEYFDLNPAIYRIAFVALALAGGTGVLLYAAAWLVLPEAEAEDSIAESFLKRHRDHPRRILGLSILGVVAILALTSAHVWPAPGNLWIALVIGIVALAWWRLGPHATARRRIVAATLATLAVLAVVALVVAVRVPLFAGVGNRVVQPVVAGDLNSRYELGIGHLRLDLGQLTLPRGETFVTAKVGIGDLRVVVPPNATVEVNARAQVGDARVLDQEDSGTHVHLHVVDRTGSGRVLVLNLRTGLGHVEVARG